MHLFGKRLLLCERKGGNCCREVQMQYQNGPSCEHSNQQIQKKHLHIVDTWKTCHLGEFSGDIWDWMNLESLFDRMHTCKAGYLYGDDDVESDCLDWQMPFHTLHTWKVFRLYVYACVLWGYYERWMFWYRMYICMGDELYEQHCQRVCQCHAPYSSYFLMPSFLLEKTFQTYKLQMSKGWWDWYFVHSIVDIIPSLYSFWYHTEIKTYLNSPFNHSISAVSFIYNLASNKLRHFCISKRGV